MFAKSVAESLDSYRKRRDGQLVVVCRSKSVVGFVFIPLMFCMHDSSILVFLPRSVNVGYTHGYNNGSGCCTFQGHSEQGRRR